ncbi:MAG: DJ-1/PfpI family protein [gamma proteobacterium symbiont of Bathyaustriella thionipta]|nr:DJ-1/PfpI family protein [gamma proteobacterium symbiont of Bathyaustriella thionipta]MCU7948829.1 DJ-1/PfpI family protein [gamma proteobacterium symbiont of Bathyaustriella thionipta]MCU7954360.1 DJ-1/PfpI family protein [gamma proteobacterium symbiont of Bathyaustriella thionipta]MCU7955287.1 DJ-1/PfpI family protein [gamma proteobacterium symbiont of Bathyaustriella thionipta]MCU7965895.1 DJ-1/PfpI family protein [gamma proteobacterium symbiont of Bathyaustriella thionipta]
MANVLVPIAPGCEELEAVTIIDLLRRADISVTTASLDSGSEVNPVTASRGVVLLPDSTLDQAILSDFDMLVLPGGLPGAEHLDNDPRIHSLLRKMSGDGKYTAAICAAPKILANAKLLEGKSATSYPGFIDKMSLHNTQIKEDAVVHDGKVITSRGPGTAMDFALSLIEILAGKDKRDEVAAGLLWK